jgi:hypothetical protein
MKKLQMRPVLSIFLVIFLSNIFFMGCARPNALKESYISNKVPATKSRMASASFEFSSKFSDGLIVPCKKGTRETIQGIPGYLFHENAILEKSLMSYMKAKFSKVTPGSPTKIKIVLNDLWIEQYGLDIGSDVTLPDRNEILNIVVAHLDLSVEVINHGEIINKVMLIDYDTTLVTGFGLNLVTEAFKDQEDLQSREAQAIGGANDLVIMFIDQFLSANKI